MKILYVITKGNWGGAQKYVFDMASHLPTSEFQVKVAHGVGDILPQKLSAVGIKTVHLPRLGRDVNILKDALVFADLIRLYRKERPDIVHLNSSKIGGLGALAARVTGIKKIVFTVHGFAFNESRPLWQKKLIAFLSWLTIVFCTDVIFISKTELERAKAWPFISKKARLIYNGIESPDFLSKEASRSELASLLHLSPEVLQNARIVGTIAELTTNKGLRYAIEAFTSVSNATYIIIGRGELEDSLRTLIKEKNLEGKVLLTGFVKDASRLLAAFDIFLLPSLKEGMPYVLFEAGFASLPVISTDVGGIGEIITHDVSGLLIKPQDSEPIKKSVITLLDDPHKARDFGNKLHEHTKNHFALQHAVDNTVALYRTSTI
jgi:glycosyltransferase involved in cell wall biosynthesis